MSESTSSRPVAKRSPPQVPHEGKRRVAGTVALGRVVVKVVPGKSAGEPIRAHRLCLTCGKVLRWSGNRPGRPAEYCRARCARAREFLRRRLRRRVRSLERAVDGQRKACRTFGSLATELRYPGGGGTPASLLRGLERELKAARTSLAAVV